MEYIKKYRIAISEILDGKDNHQAIDNLLEYIANEGVPLTEYERYLFTPEFGYDWIEATDNVGERFYQLLLWDSNQWVTLSPLKALEIALIHGGDLDMPGLAGLQLELDNQ